MKLHMGGDILGGNALGGNARGDLPYALGAPSTCQTLTLV